MAQHLERGPQARAPRLSLTFATPRSTPTISHKPSNGLAQTTLAGHKFCFLASQEARTRICAATTIRASPRTTPASRHRWIILRLCNCGPAHLIHMSAPGPDMNFDQPLALGRLVP